MKWILLLKLEIKIIPFEVKYRSQHTNTKALKGLLELCQKKNIDRGYVVTKSLDDFGLMNLPNVKTKICIYLRHYYVIGWVN